MLTSAQWSTITLHAHLKFLRKFHVLMVLLVNDGHELGKEINHHFQFYLLI